MHQSAAIRLDKLLSSLGYCSRREVTRLIRCGRITVRGVDKPAGDMKIDPACVEVDGESLDPLQGVVIAMNKPTGYVCSRSTSEGATVYDLLPPRFAARNPPVVTIGRLDRETSGLLLLTDDGALVHRITSPRHEIEKIYVAVLKSKLRGDEAQRFASGELCLAGDRKPLKPCTLRKLDDCRVEIRLREGRYHQIRRMFSAVDNEVIDLMRTAIGSLTLQGIAEGSYRLLSEDELARLFEETAD